MAARHGGDVLVLMRMGQGNSVPHLEPLAAAVSPAWVHVIRPDPQPTLLTAPNIRYRDVSGGGRLWEVVKAFCVALVTTIRKRPGWILSFNAYPYGLMACAIGVLTRTRVHVGFVGSDIAHLKRRQLGLRLLKHAQLYTAPGPTTIKQLAGSGIDGPIKVLPHGVDPERFSLRDIPRDIDVIYVGALIPRKRVDSIIHAIAKAKGRMTGIKCLIVGDGPERAMLEELASDLGLGERTVQFVGQRTHPEEWLERSKSLLMPSAWEGLAFALIEAMRCGVVPIVTPVASTPDLVSDGSNGVLLNSTAHHAIAESLIGVLSDDARWDQMSKEAAASTANFTYDAVEHQWKRLLVQTGHEAR